MSTFLSIKKSADKLNVRMREYIRSKFVVREKTPHLHRLFLLHGENNLLNLLDTMPTDRLLNICTAIDNAEKKAKAETAKAKEAAAQARVKAREAVVIYTDGGWSNDHRVGAGAYVILKGGHILKKGGDRLKDSTNNAAELQAILFALKAAPHNTDIEFRTDSQYAIGVLTNWKAKKNIDLINDIKTLAQKKGINMSFSWVKGHSGDKYNEICDRMCDQMAGMDLNREYKRFRTKTKLSIVSFSPNRA